jgi:Soluble NSF attachment protein, SNAP
MVCERSGGRVVSFNLWAHSRLANKSWLKVADLAALAGQYQRAIDRYESVARSSLNSSLTKWSVKDYFFKAGACYLANKVFLPIDFLIGRTW